MRPRSWTLIAFCEGSTLVAPSSGWSAFSHPFSGNSSAMIGGESGGPRDNGVVQNHVSHGIEGATQPTAASGEEEREDHHGPIKKLIHLTPLSGYPYSRTIQLYLFRLYIMNIRIVKFCTLAPKR